MTNYDALVKKVRAFRAEKNKTARYLVGRGAPRAAVNETIAQGQRAATCFENYVCFNNMAEANGCTESAEFAIEWLTKLNKLLNGAA